MKWIGKPVLCKKLSSSEYFYLQQYLISYLQDTSWSYLDNNEDIFWRYFFLYTFHPNNLIVPKLNLKHFCCKALITRKLMKQSNICIQIAKSLGNDSSNALEQVTGSAHCDVCYRVCGRQMPYWVPFTNLAIQVVNLTNCNINYNKLQWDCRFGGRIAGFEEYTGGGLWAVPQRGPGQSPLSGGVGALKAVWCISS